MEYGVDTFFVRTLRSREAILAASFAVFEEVDRGARYTLKHKDEESGHLVNISDFKSLQNNEKTTIILRPPGKVIILYCRVIFGVPSYVVLLFNVFFLLSSANTSSGIKRKCTERR